ncbi:MAG: DUF2950 domain-containing protein [Gammaproteobacteria bacterium]|nr:DUF2950 domain-containing protein [Gammaproteobacteria bacterium]
MKRGYLQLCVALFAMGPSAATLAQDSQRHFDTAEQAANSLVIAIARDDKAALTGIFGSGYGQILPPGAVTEEKVDRFLDGWARFNTLQSVDDKTRLLSVGSHGWTFPVPIVREVEGWRFDSEAGKDQIRLRRIGRNELAAMQAALAYVDAQFEYAGQDHDGDGVLEYAQRFISREGTRDGLYWDSAAGEPQSPLGPLLASHNPGDDYHGYRYRILTRQGDNAPGGALDYVDQGNMVNGFALVAWPADYGDTGVMSFLLGRNGVLYEADLGPDGAAYASAVTAYDPDRRWSPVAASFIDPDN